MSLRGFDGCLAREPSCRALTITLATNRQIHDLPKKFLAIFSNEITVVTVVATVKQAGYSQLRTAAARRLFGGAGNGLRLARGGHYD
ncbi:MAG: hypothetical protein AB7E74_06155 [Pirellulales bacterium]